jgi:hypothetical protein
MIVFFSTSGEFKHEYIIVIMEIRSFVSLRFLYFYKRLPDNYIRFFFFLLMKNEMVDYNNT